MEERKGIARRPRAMPTLAHATEYVRDALGNDIGIMANERNDERAEGLEPGPHRGPIEGGPQGNYTSKQGAVPARL